MPRDFTAVAFVTIDGPRSAVWHSLTDPGSIKQYMFGTGVETNWKEGSAIRWHAEFDGKPYTDTGEVIAFEPERLLKFSRFSSASGKSDTLDNYHYVTIELTPIDGKTRVALTQDNNSSAAGRDHSERTWKLILENLKKHVESASVVVRKPI